MTNKVTINAYSYAIECMILKNGFEPDFALRVVESFLDRKEKFEQKQEDTEIMECLKSVLEKAMEGHDWCDTFDEDEPCDSGMEECLNCGECCA